MLEKLQKALWHFIQKKHFVFRFQDISTDTIVNDTNVIEYEFVNVGQSEIDINGARLLPFPSAFHRVKLNIYTYEMDTTIYRIKFIKGAGECTATFTSSLCACALLTDDGDNLLTDDGVRMCTDQ